MTHSFPTLRSSDLRAAGVARDLADPATMDALAEDTAALFGPPDILVNAAGVNLREPPEAITPESWHRTLTLNLTIPFFLARARSEEHTSELQSLMRISYAVFCLKTKKYI